MHKINSSSKKIIIDSVVKLYVYNQKIKKRYHLQYKIQLYVDNSALWDKKQSNLFCVVYNIKLYNMHLKMLLFMAHSTEFLFQSKRY